MGLSANNLDTHIAILTTALEKNPKDDSLYLERGKLYHRKGQFDKALNDFTRAAALNPENREADSYIEILREIFNYRYKDLYNP